MCIIDKHGILNYFGELCSVYPFASIFSIHVETFIWVCLAAGPPSPADHLREVFYRMGLNDKVNLSAVY